MDTTKIAVDIFNDCAVEYQEKFMDVSLYHDTLDLFCQSVKKENARILELACGPGNFSRYLLERRPDFELLGTDLSANMLHLARQNNPSAKFQIMDCRQVGLLKGSYDAVVCAFGLPYLSKKESIQFIRDISTLLPAGGVFYLSTMEDDYARSGFQEPSSGGKQQMYINFHQADYLTMALEESGFHLLLLDRKQYSRQNGKPVTDLILIAGR